MNEAYVSYETAKLLKEKWFTIPSNASYEDCIWQMYDENGKVHWGIYCCDWYFRITQQLAQRWLIETHNIHIETHFLRASGDYVYDIIHSPLKLDDIHSFPIVFNTREDAIEAALEYALKNLI